MQSTLYSGIAALALFIFMVISFSGCTSRPDTVKDADAFKRKALLQYQANTDLIHEAEQNAYRTASLKLVDALFQADMAEINKHIGADGKVEAKFAFELLTRAMTNRDKNRAAVEDEINNIKSLVNKADKDFITALKIDEMLGQFYDAGIQPSDAQAFVDQILQVVQKK